MEVRTSLITGDDDETAVFALSFTESLFLIFKFCLDPRMPTSVPSRIVTCFHDLTAKDEKTSFPNRDLMRQAIYSLIGQVWPQCAIHPSVKLPDVVIEIYEKRLGGTQWRVSHEGTYGQFLDILLPLTYLPTFKCDTWPLNVQKYVHYSSIIPVEVLGGRGSSMLVRISRVPGALYVYKGLSFSMYLESANDFIHERNAFYHEVRTTCSMPRHPNIITPPNCVVLADTVGNPQTLFCGTLYRYMKNGSLQLLVDNCQAARTRLPLKDKAKWCYQMASALSHTLFKACAYHMDFKPSNLLLNDDMDLILIDWEQCGASPSFLAPEANGLWDVEEVYTSYTQTEEPARIRSILLYKEYQGPSRQNLWTWPKWNVFPIWRKSCPRALEAAEVFSLGRSMWVLLQQVPEDCGTSDGSNTTLAPVIWDDETSDIPQKWKDIVSRCVELDPNKRIVLSEVLEFWEKESHVYLRDN